MYLGGIHIIKFRLVFLLLICLLLWEGVGLSQKPRRINGKYIFSFANSSISGCVCRSNTPALFSENKEMVIYLKVRAPILGLQPGIVDHEVS